MRAAKGISDLTMATEGEGASAPPPPRAGAAEDMTSADYYFDSYSHFGIHEEMLKDEVRGPWGGKGGGVALAWAGGFRRPLRWPISEPPRRVDTDRCGRSAACVLLFLNR